MSTRITSDYLNGTTGAFQTGRDLWELSHGNERIGQFVNNSLVSNIGAGLAVAGAASQVAQAYYNPYAAAVVAAPVLYEGAKWLWNQL